MDNRIITRHGNGKPSIDNLLENELGLDANGTLYTKIKNDSDSSQEKIIIINPYRVGDIFLSVNSENPSSFLGGQWSLFAQGRTIMGVSTTDSDFGQAKIENGSATATLSKDNMPPHTHTKGNMNITGSFSTRPMDLDNDDPILDDYSGAFSRTKEETAIKYGFDYANTLVNNRKVNKVIFNANENEAWTGETSEEGNGESFDILPPYITCYIWIKTSD